MIILAFIILSFACAGLTSLLLVCFQEGMIFSAYGRWLNRHKDKFWYKPAGGCGDCFCVWIGCFGCCYCHSFLWGSDHLLHYPAGFLLGGLILFAGSTYGFYRLIEK